MLALPAFFASAAGTSLLQNEILSDCAGLPDDPLVDSYTATWSTSFGAPPVGPASHKQAVWDRSGIVAIKDELQTVLTDPRLKASFLAATAPQVHQTVVDAGCSKDAGPCFHQQSTRLL